jgi:Zn-finger nucleic acid-binding protein
MTNAWEERKKALENEYFHKKEQELLQKMKHEAEETLARSCCHNRCPKCGENLEPLTFRGVPLDKCPACGGIWLGPNDLKMLAEKDHRSWFDRWFHAENDETTTDQEV